MTTTVQTLDFSVDLLRALLWQYNDAEKLQGILSRKAAWYETNQREFWANWVRDVFDLRTANDFGLAVWSIILDQPLFAIVEGYPSTDIAWGHGGFRKNFDNGGFVPLGDNVVKLSTEQARLVLRLRYFQLTTRGAVPEINRFLRDLFADYGAVYVLDGLDMTLTYVFTFAPNAEIRFVLQNFDLLPRPAGVGVGYVITTRENFGFDQYRKNFDNGNFVQGL